MYFCLQCGVVHHIYTAHVIIFKSGFRYINDVRIPVGLCSLVIQKIL